MLGTIVNVIAIISGCIVGLIIKGGLSEKVSNTVMNGLALCVTYIGISGSLKGNNTLLIIISIAVGSLIGEIIDIDQWLKNLGDYLQEKFKKNNNSSFSEGFVSSSLLFCVGAMAIVGSLESGLQGKHDILFAKSILDGIGSIIFASSLGVGVLFSSISVLIYQGSITLGASFLKGILIDSVINNMAAVGSLLIIGLGLNMLGVTKIKVANLLPAVFIPIIYSFFV